MFSIPQLVFGDKIKPKSVQFYDNLFDDNVVITDDGYQNLIAGTNLFSKVQEVRYFPSGSNQILQGMASYVCPMYSGSIQNYVVEPLAKMNVSFQYGSLSSGVPRIDYPIMRMAFLSGSLINSVVSSSYPPQTASVSMGFLSGSLFDTLIYVNGGSDTGSVTNIGFLSGSIFNALIFISGSNETSSFVMGFLSGSIFTGLVIFPPQYESSGTLKIGFNSGYIM